MAEKSNEIKSTGDDVMASTYKAFGINVMAGHFFPAEAIIDTIHGRATAIKPVKHSRRPRLTCLPRKSDEVEDEGACLANMFKDVDKKCLALMDIYTDQGGRELAALLGLAEQNGKIPQAPSTVKKNLTLTDLQTQMRHVINALEPKLKAKRASKLLKMLLVFISATRR